MIWSDRNSCDVKNLHEISCWVDMLSRSVKNDIISHISNYLEICSHDVAFFVFVTYSLACSYARPQHMV